jgi:gluconokinase
MPAVRPLVVVTGVAGSGKSTVGAALAVRLGVDFADGDAFHSPESIAAMRAGMPLTDDDRSPWLAAVAQWLADHQEAGGVVACSALRRAYRDVLRRAGPDAWLVHLDLGRELVAARVAARTDHFMPVELVQSQLDILEPPEPDERAVIVDASQPVEQVVAAALDAIG